jgi:pimeloyl-ACP methyl ester carboxylesterase
VVTPRNELVETPVVFGRDRSLIGVVCQPTARPRGPTPFVVFLSSGIIHRIGPNRIYVRIARALAREGVSSLRFDLSGIGDSLRPAVGEGVPTQERVVADVDDALEFLRDTYGSHAYILVGLCSGADNALRTMGREPRVVGSVLLDLNVPRTPGYFVRHYAAKALSVTFWSNILRGRRPVLRRLRHHARPRTDGASVDAAAKEDLNAGAWLPRDVMQAHLERIAARGGHLLCVFTPGLGQYSYRNQFWHLFPSLDFDGRLTLEYFADSDHTFSTEALRERLTRTILDWVREAFQHPSPHERARGPEAVGKG